MYDYYSRVSRVRVYTSLMLLLLMINVKFNAEHIVTKLNLVPLHLNKDDPRLASL